MADWLRVEPCKAPSRRFDSWLDLHSLNATAARSEGGLLRLGAKWWIVAGLRLDS